jgi:DedD protein
LAHHTEDDGFHEIQLNGKQLVFVFMAATVVSVVIFLCGVLVGRGVRGEREPAATTAEVTPPDEIRPALPGDPKPPTVEPGDDPTKAPPPAPPAGDAERGGRDLVKPAAEPEAPRESALAPAAAAVPAVKPDAVAARAEAPAPKTAAAPKPEPAPKAPAKGEPAPKVASELPAVDDPRRGWVIQVAATKTRGEADGLAKELGAKGYTAFVLSGSSNVFRVRVGGYKSKRDAETVAAKLRKEERINPWVTR